MNFNYIKTDNGMWDKFKISLIIIILILIITYILIIINPKIFIIEKYNDNGGVYSSNYGGVYNSQTYIAPPQIDILIPPSAS